MAPFSETQLLDMLASLLGSRREADVFWQDNQHLDQVELLQEAQKHGKNILAARRRAERRREAERTLATTTGGEVVDGEKLLFTARALALCGLPHKKTKDTHVVKEATLADGRQIIVTYSAGEAGLALPFGKDRTTLTWFITKSRKANSRRITFKNAKMFVREMELPNNGKAYKDFLASFDRITSMNCTIRFKDTSGGTSKGKTTIIEQSYVPSAADMEAESSGLQRLLGATPTLRDAETARPSSSYSKEGLHEALSKGEAVSISLKGAMHIEVNANSPSQDDEYVVVFDENFFQEFIRFPVALPLEAMKEFTDQPLLWDFIQYLAYLAAEAPDAHHVIHIKELSDRLGSRDKNVRKLRLRIEEALRDKLKVILPHVHFDPKAKGDNSLLVIGPAPEHLRPKLPAPETLPELAPTSLPTLGHNDGVIDVEIVSPSAGDGPKPHTRIRRRLSKLRPPKP